MSLIAYSPLAQGLLTGKYGPNRPPPGVRRLRTPVGLLERLPLLLDAMRQVGEAHDGKTPLRSLSIG